MSKRHFLNTLLTNALVFFFFIFFVIFLCFSFIDVFGLVMGERFGGDLRPFLSESGWQCLLYIKNKFYL